ncbi:MAG: hypothetical protein M3O28_05325, partial [Actinomycetota bacterium]|nr:hypothetical protein [Actinomycetota bacterium]
FIQFVFLDGLNDEGATRGPHPEGGQAAVSTGVTPLAVSTGYFTTSSGPVEIPAAQFVHLYVAAGAFTVHGRQLRQGDSVRAADQAMLVTGDGDLLVWTSG